MVEQARHDPRVIGGIYRIGQVIRQSSVLSIYTAYNRNTNDVVGLQVIELPPNFDVQTVEQLLQPLERRRTIQSPHVLPVYDWGIDGTRAYIATAPPRGVSLRQVLDDQDVGLQRALDFARQITRGLSELHKQSLGDIDLRPEVITVDITEATDRVQLDDVGLRPLLRKLGYFAVPTLDDIGYRDPRYASPESITGPTVGPSSDVYQLGLLLFELVTGRLPFVGRNAEETEVLQRTSPVPRMTDFKPDIPVALQNLVDRALAKDQSSRFLHAEAMLAALEAVQLPRQYADLSLLDTLVGDKPSSLSASTIMPALPTKEGVYAYLCYEQGGTEMQRFPITAKDVVVGRADPKRSYIPDIDLTKLDPKMTVSRKHARIRYEGTAFYIEDLKSHNRTRLDSRVLTPAKPELLQHGSAVQFGAVRLEFKVPGMSKRET